MLLTDNAIRNCKPGATTIKLRDGGSLFVHVQPNGTKRFVMPFRFQGKQRSLSLGVYPTISLKEARKRRDAAKELLAKGVDPSRSKRVESSGENTLRGVCQLWHGDYSKGVIAKTAERSWNLLERFILPKLGDINIMEVKRRDLTLCIDPILKKENYETAAKLCRVVTSVFDHALNLGIIEYTVATGLSKIVPAFEVEHRAAILDESEFARFMVALDDEHVVRSSSVVFCLKLLPYVFLRNTALRCGVWEEINFEKSEWLIPPERMKRTKDKAKRQHPHLVPLASQVVALLKELHSITGNGRYIFPSPSNRSRPISDGALRVALRGMGYPKEEVSVHGFRSTASTFLHEMGFERHIIDRQMAHKDDNRTRAAYNFAEYRDERVKMMQDWADHIDALKLRHRQQDH